MQAQSPWVSCAAEGRLASLMVGLKGSLRWACGHAGSALTTFNKGDCNLNPKVIAHRSSATRGEMLVNSKAFRQFCHKARINDNVRRCDLPPVAVFFCWQTPDAVLVQLTLGQADIRDSAHM